MSTRPNVLAIICDDLRDTIDGVGGHPQLKTPNIDRLRARGVRFTNAHCASPLCAPARAALWCGLYPHRTGNYSFGHWRDNPILKEAVPIQEHFRRSGYKVYGTGKVNHNGQEDKTTYDEWGWNDEFGPWPWKGSGRTWWTPHPDYVHLLEKTEPLVAPHARVIEGLSGESSYGPLSNRPTWPEDPEGRWPGHEGWMLYDQPFRYQGPADRDLMPDERSAEWAEEILQRSHADPFMLMVGFNRPHTPLYVPDEYLERFPLDTLELPPHLEGDLDDCPADTMRAYQPYGFDRFTLIRKVGGPENLLRYVQAYLAAVAFVDDQVGRIVDALEASPYADNTTIVFTADHGYHLGEKDIIFKDSPWEVSTRIPLIICPPANTEGPRDVECGAPVSHLDVYPTLNEICGLSNEPNAGGIERPMDGQSLSGLLSDPQGKGSRDHAVTICGGFANSGDSPDHMNLIWTVRETRYRLILYPTGERELYDHQEDPREYHNLIQDPEMKSVIERLSRKIETYKAERLS